MLPSTTCSVTALIETRFSRVGAAGGGGVGKKASGFGVIVGAMVTTGVPGGVVVKVALGLVVEVGETVAVGEAVTVGDAVAG